MNVVGLFGRALTEPVFYFLVGYSAVTTLVPYWLQRELLARMSAERRERMWNGLSWACALLWLHPALSMIPFAWVTRSKPGWKGGLLAIGWGLALAVVVVLVLELVGQGLLLAVPELAPRKRS